MSWLAARFELARGGDAGNLRPMEGLRGAAVFMVFLVHYASIVDPLLRPASGMGDVVDAVHSIGQAGVDLFFVLSGFLIYGGLIEADRPFGRYFARRVRRIYPAFLAVFLLYLALSAAQPPDQRKIPSDWLAASIYILQNLLLLPGVLPLKPFITVAWSLSYEMFFYLAMPAAIGLLALRRRSTAWRLCFFAVLTGIALALAARLGGPVRLVMFLAGAGLHDVLRHGRWQAPTGFSAIVAALLSLAALALPAPGPAAQALRSLLLFLGLGLLCWHVFARPDAGPARTLSWTPLRWLGNMSYSYYLLHGLALQAIFIALRSWTQGGLSDMTVIAALAPAFAFTLLPCAALFLAVERPFSLAPARLARRPERRLTADAPR